MFEMQARILAMQLFHTVLLVIKSVFIHYICLLAKIFRKNCWWIIFSPLQLHVLDFNLQDVNLNCQLQMCPSRRIRIWCRLSKCNYFWYFLTINTLIMNIKQVNKNEGERVYQLHHCQQKEGIPLPCLSFELLFDLLVVLCIERETCLWYSEVAQRTTALHALRKEFQYIWATPWSFPSTAWSILLQFFYFIFLSTLLLSE
jgi:hypothetical protein